MVEAPSEPPIAASPDEDGDGGERAAATRLYVILARDAPTGVVFRRGPSKHVQLLSWDLRTDRVTSGQWLKGRIYERRCDLSPSGDLLVYLATKYPNEFEAWTAVSRPPYLTALALWPKRNGTYGGGGLFEDETRLLLNHREDERDLAAGFQLKRGMTVAPLDPVSGRGEDEPILSHRRRRDGWSLVCEGSSLPYDPYSGGWTIEPPQVWRKRGRNGRLLEEHLHSVGRRGHPWYGTSFRVLDGEETPLFDLPATDWADWDRGDLLMARDGKLFRLRKSDFRRYPDDGESALHLVADLNASRFEPITAPAQAKRW
ncbi:hypothetical protein [Aureimonas sp. ME7]|uniref:hypothetical protein n=1 Tax=Aureimonas sp. ME7 TaxID=2744252 RepID=UPI001AED6076|nr:hypothetical protein [Aureimonas sp. ME7]